MQKYDRALEAIIRFIGGTEDDVTMLRQEVTELRGTVERQAALLAWLKEENERHHRNASTLWERMQEEAGGAAISPHPAEGRARDSCKPDEPSPPPGLDPAG